MDAADLRAAILRIHELLGPEARIVYFASNAEFVSLQLSEQGIEAASHHDLGSRLDPRQLGSLARELDVDLVTGADGTTFRRLARDPSELRAAVAAVARAGDAALALAQDGERIETGLDEPLVPPPPGAHELAWLLYGLEVAAAERVDVLVDRGLTQDVCVHRDPDTGVLDVSDVGACLDGLEADLLNPELALDFAATAEVLRPFAETIPDLLVGTGIQCHAFGGPQDLRIELRCALGAADDARHAVDAVADACRRVEEAFRSWSS